MYRSLFSLFCLIPFSIYSQTLSINPVEPPENIPSQAPDTLNRKQADSMALNQVGVLHLHSFYSDGIISLQQTAFQYVRRTPNQKLTLVGRASVRSRNETQSFKYDLESYVKHGSKSYSFLGVSVSDQRLFPNYEAFYSLYKSLPKGWELETGAKFMKAENFQLFTPILGISKEMEHSRLTVRNLFTIAEASLYYSMGANWKRFVNEKRDNISIMGGFGNAPDSKSLDFTQDFMTNKSVFLGVGAEKKLNPFTASIAAVYNKNHYSTGSKFDQYDLYLNLLYDF